MSIAYLLEAADDICYAILDLEDAVELHTLSFENVAQVLLESFTNDERTQIRSTLDGRSSVRVNLTRLRSPVFKMAISAALEAFVKAYDQIMDGTFQGELLTSLPSGDPRNGTIERAKNLTRELVYSDSKKVELELGAYSVFETLLGAFCRAALVQAQSLKGAPGEVDLGGKSTLVLRLLGSAAPNSSNAPNHSHWSEYQCLRRVIDYVTGMTDNYATYIARQIQGAGFSGVQRP